MPPHGPPHHHHHGPPPHHHHHHGPPPHHHHVDHSKLLQEMKEDLEALNKFNKLEEERNNKLMQYIKEYKESNNKLRTDSPSHFFEDVAYCDLSKYGNVDLNGKKGISLIGPVSAGKSSIINALASKNICMVGLGETTVKVEAKMASGNLVIFDVPGANDKITYLEIEHLILLNAMTLVVVVYNSDPSHVYNTVKICQSLSLPFIAVRNKLDDVRETPQKLQILKDKEETQLKGFIEDQSLFKGLFFLSAMNKINNSNELFDWNSFLLAVVNCSDKPPRVIKERKMEIPQELLTPNTPPVMRHSPHGPPHGHPHGHPPPPHGHHGHPHHHHHHGPPPHRRH